MALMISSIVCTAQDGGLPSGKRIKIQKDEIKTNGVFHEKSNSFFIDPPFGFEATYIPDVGVQCYWGMAPPNEAWLGYDDGTNSNNPGAGGGGTYYTAIRFDTASLSNYDNWQLTKFSFFPKKENLDSEITFILWEDTNAYFQVYEQVLENLSWNAWNTIELDEPQILNADKELWVGFQVSSPEGEDPIGHDYGPAIPGYGDLISFNGTTWESLSNAYGFDFNYNLQIFVEEDPNLIDSEFTHQEFFNKKLNKRSWKNERLEYLGVNIYRDGNLLNNTPVEPDIMEYLDEFFIPGTWIYSARAVYDAGLSDPTPEIEVIIQGYPEISINPDSLFEIHENPPQITIKELIITNNGDEVLDWEIEIDFRNKKSKCLKSNTKGFNKFLAEDLNNDVGIWSIVEPASGVYLGTEEPVTIKIRNYGIENQTEIPWEVTWSGPTGSGTFSGTWTGNLIAGEDLIYTLAETMDMSVFGDYEFEACTQLPDDENTDNDCKTKWIGYMEPTDWLFVDQHFGTLQPGQSEIVTVSFNSEGLEVGNYSGNISVTSNDPAYPDVDIPVTLEVTQADEDLLIYETFEDYETGEPLVQQALAQGKNYWTTLNNQPGGSEDPMITYEAGVGINGVLIENGNEAVMQFEDIYTDGVYNIEISFSQSWWNNKGILNFLQNFDGENSQSGLQIIFGQNGNAMINAGGENAEEINFYEWKWHRLRCRVDIDNDLAQLYFNDEFIIEWQWSLGALGNGDLNELSGIHFSGNVARTAEIYYDHIIVLEGEWPEILPPVNFELGYNPGCSGYFFTWQYPGSRHKESSSLSATLTGFNFYGRDREFGESWELLAENIQTTAYCAGWPFTDLWVEFYVTAVYDWEDVIIESGRSDTYEEAENIDETDQFISVSPNPAEDWINIKVKSPMNQIKIFNINGRIALSKNGSGKELTINTQNLMPGIYTLLIETEKGISVHKLVVR